MEVKQIISSFLVLLIFYVSFGQDHRLFDSLAYVFHHGQHADSSKYDLLRQLTFNANNPDTSLYYAELYLQSANNDEHKGIAYYYIGTAYRMKGDYPIAVECYHKSLELARAVNRKDGVANSLSALGDVYSLIGNHPSSVKYYNQAVELLRQEEDYKLLGSTLLNLGDEYFNAGKLDTALVYFNEAGKLFEQITYRTGIAYTNGNIGLVHAALGDHTPAEESIHTAVDMLLEMEDYYGVSVYLTYMADIYMEKGDTERALEYAQESLRIGEELGLKEQIRDASLKLSELYEHNGNIPQAYTYHKQYVAYRDSINNEETIQKIADLRTEYEVGQKQAEVDLLTAEKRNQQLVLIATGAFAFVLIILAAIIFKYYRDRSKTAHILTRQKEELERLNQTKDKFFSIISHDLRGPVSSFMGISFMIRHFVNSKDTNQLLEVADDIDTSVKRLSNLLDNLLNWAMQQQGSFPYVPEKLNFNELADELVQTLSTMAEGKKIRLQSEISESVVLWADKNTTMTILRNLVSNSLKFTPEGGEVKIRAISQGEHAEIIIADTGVGMPKEKLERLFSLEAKKSTFGTSGEKGLGLGLQLVKEFVDMNQGQIRVSSDEGQGTTFTVRLPLYEKELVEVVRP